jgi:hypothetical protein
MTGKGQDKMSGNASRKIKSTIMTAIAASCFGAAAISLAAASVPAAATGAAATAAAPGDINWG